MIRIIKGSYGLEADGTVKAMGPGSEPFSLSEERESELVALGVAEKVDAPEPVEISSDTDGEETEKIEESEDPYADKTMAELRREAAERGVDVKQARSKREVIAALEAEAEKQAEESGEGAE